MLRFLMVSALSARDSLRSSVLSWLFLVGAGLVIGWLTDRLDPHLVPDSPSYLEYSFDSLEEIARSIRTPGYPAWLWLLTQTFGIEAVPAAQIIVHATAVWWLLIELKCWSLPRVQRWAAAVAVGVGCTAMDHISTVSTDLLAASVGVMVVVAMLRWVRQDGSLRAGLLVVVLAVVAIFIRPAYLFLIPWSFVAGSMLHRMRGKNWRSSCQSSLAVSGAMLIPILAWMLMRLAVVGDFAIVPFGHQNLAAILVQLVSDEELQNLGGNESAMGRAVVEQKRIYEASGRRFAEGEPVATMTIDARWDDMTYLIVVPASQQVAGEDPIASHRAVADLNKTIILRWPIRYLIWLAKSARRGAWAIAADIVMHPVFLAAIAVAIIALLWRATSGAFPMAPAQPTDGLRALAIVALTYMIAKLGFVILTSPGIGRFSDAAAIFVPAFAAATLLHWWNPPPVGRNHSL